MKALLFAAGMGTRLRPITNTLPKALAPIGGKPLLEWNIEHLIRYGVKTIVINLHYRGDQIRDFVASRSWDADIVFSDESDQLLETGGGLLKAAPLLRGKMPFWMYNVDILSNINLRAMLLRWQEQQQPLALLAVRQRVGSRQLLWESPQNRLCGWMNRTTGDVRMAFTPLTPPSDLAFSGIHLASPRLLDIIPQKGVFSITDTYLSLAAEYPILAYRHDADKWIDVGSPEKMEEATKLFAE